MPETDIIPGGSTSTETIVKFGDKLSLNREDDLALQIALQLYTYTDFEKVKDFKKHAGLCLARANKFVEAYNAFKEKNKLENLENQDNLEDDNNSTDSNDSSSNENIYYSNISNIPLGEWEE